MSEVLHDDTVCGMVHGVEDVVSGEENCVFSHPISLIIVVFGDISFFLN